MMLMSWREGRGEGRRRGGGRRRRAGEEEGGGGGRRRGGEGRSKEVEVWREYVCGTRYVCCTGEEGMLASSPGSPS